MANGDCSQVAELGLLIAVASLVAEHRFQGTWASVVATRGLSGYSSRALQGWLHSCGTQAELLLSMWDLPGSEMNPCLLKPLEMSVKLMERNDRSLIHPCFFFFYFLFYIEVW